MPQFISYSGALNPVRYLFCQEWLNPHNLSGTNTKPHFVFLFLGQILYAMGQIQYLGMLMLWYKFSMAVMDRSILECASIRSALVRSHISMKGLIGWLVPLPRIPHWRQLIYGIFLFSSLCIGILSGFHLKTTLKQK